MLRVIMALVESLQAFTIVEVDFINPGIIAILAELFELLPRPYYHIPTPWQFFPRGVSLSLVSG